MEHYSPHCKQCIGNFLTIKPMGIDSLCWPRGVNNNKENSQVEIQFFGPHAG